MMRWLPAVTSSLLLAIAGCGDSSRLKIGMMPKLVGISYFDATHKGAREAAAELDVELQYDGPVAARVEEQVKMLRNWQALGIDVLAVAPNDPEVISETLKTAGERGMTVLTWDTDANPTASGRSIFVNQVPNQAIGEMLVDVMAEGIRNRGEELGGKYLVVSGTPTASNQNTWMAIMQERIREKYPEMELLPHLTPGEDQSKALSMTAAALNAHGDLKGIWGITSVAIPAAAKAVRDAGKSDQIYVTGLGLPGQMKEYVKRGEVEKFLLWDAVELGYLTVYVAQRVHQDGGLADGSYDFGRLKGIEVRGGQAILGPPLVFDADNIDNYDF